ncbi:outer membrane protein transport protein [Flavobacterium sp. N3904]|uniref:outer membrane protein transport protein n=1 Tax=Flavobacterium sp. N3904 TaxID=2986835 RepID=UPI0022257E0D|nr:outer membrane protein transport protein [Flavobacterium sp. N3904]
MKKNSSFLVLVFLAFFISNAQSISTSPYSLYGLGSLYESNFGLIPAIGNSGIGLPSGSFINNKNAASLVNIPMNNFFFEFGGTAIQTSFQNNSKTENRNNFQFSHLAFAFPITTKSAFSLALMPYSSSSFIISDVKISIIDGSNEYYNLDVIGSGGLNNLDLSYAYKVTNKLSFGMSASVLFGSTKDDRTYTINNTVTLLDKKTSYNGIRPILSSQFKIDPDFTFGLNVKTPTKINAAKVQYVAIANSTGSSVLESDKKTAADDFYLPLEIGVGINKVFKNKLSVTFDYEKRFWDATNQSDLYGDFTNQQKFALGFSYQKAKESRNYFDRIRFATGLNYDSGYLQINNRKIDDKSFSIGLSLPFDRNSSALFVSYSYGEKGKITNSLIKEDYHKLTLSLNLDGIWFVKRKID